MPKLCISVKRSCCQQEYNYQKYKVQLLQMDPLYHKLFPNLYFTLPVINGSNLQDIYQFPNLLYNLKRLSNGFNLILNQFTWKFAPHWFSSISNQLNSSELYYIFPTAYKALNSYFVSAFI